MVGDKLTKKKITPYEQELLKATKKVKEYKLSCEANIVSILWKDPEMYYAYDGLKLEHFSENVWRVYWTIGYDIIIKEKKQALDEVTVGLYLEKHPKLSKKYDEYGGYEKIEQAKEYVKIKNIEGYVDELNKWNTVLKLLKMKFPVYDRLDEFVDMSADEIYEEYEAKLNHVFINVDGKDKTYDIADGIDELIEELNEGSAVGLPYYNSPLLTKEIGGSLEGNITLIGGLSGVGKTTFLRNTKIPSIIENGERMVIMINEEGKKKWQRELLVWVANNIIKKDLQKYTVRDGKYDKETRQLLYDSAKWIKKNKDIIKLKPFEKYTTSKAIKTIKKYASMGVKYFALDTYKADSTTLNSEAFWFNMQQNMVEIYNTIKSEVKNVHIDVTFQLAKSSSRQRYYTQDNIGMAKNIVDVASTCLMMRKPFADEYEGEKNKLKCYRLEGKNGRSKIPFTLKKDKHYQLIFIVKNREGSTNEYQIVVEHDLSRNVYKEIGICEVPVDF